MNEIHRADSVDSPNADTYPPRTQLAIVQRTMTAHHPQDKVGQYCLSQGSGHRNVYAPDVNAVLLHVQPEYFLEEYTLGVRSRKHLHPDDYRVRQILEASGGTQRLSVRLDDGGVLRATYRAYLLAQMENGDAYHAAYHLVFGWAREPLESCCEALRQRGAQQYYDYVMKMTLVKPETGAFYLPVFHVDGAVALQDHREGKDLYRQAASTAEGIRALPWEPARTAPPPPPVTAPTAPLPPTAPFGPAPASPETAASGWHGIGGTPERPAAPTPAVRSGASAPVASAMPAPAASPAPSALAQHYRPTAVAMETQFLRRIFATGVNMPAEAFARMKYRHSCGNVSAEELEAARQALFATVVQRASTVGLPDATCKEWLSWLNEMPVIRS